MKVLMVSGMLPTDESPGTLAPVSRQIESLEPLVEKIGGYQITGLPALKYLLASGPIRRESRNYDLVHAHYGLCGYSATLGKCRPVVLSLMGSDVLSPPQGSSYARILLALEHVLARATASRADSVIVKSSEMADKLSPIESHIIPNGVDMDAFHPMPRLSARKRLGWDEHARLVLFGGNPSDSNKNYSLAMKAVSVATNRLKKTVRLIPLMGFSPETVPTVMNACDVMILTSFKEGSPNVVKECLACNRPVVSVRVGDVESVIGSTAGCHIGDYSPESLAEGLCGVLEHSQDINGRDTLWRLGLDLQATAKRVVQVYSQVLS